MELKEGRRRRREGEEEAGEAKGGGEGGEKERGVKRGKRKPRWGLPKRKREREGVGWVG